MNVKIETELHRRLVDHRGACPDCTETRACLVYIEIAKASVEARVLWAGPVMPRTVMSIREAAGF